MKDQLSHLNPAWSTGPGAVAAAAVACGYWVSQILETNLVSSAEMGNSSMIPGALCFGIFGVLFVMHLFKPLSKAAAILGLASFGVFTIAMAYQCLPHIAHYLSVGAYLRSIRLTSYAFSASTVLGLAGVAMDAAGLWRVFRGHGNGSKPVLPA
jgi:hypothetical protein